MTVFTNATNIPIGPNIGASSLYPSNISVTGLSGTVSKVTVSLINLTHAFNADIEVVLQAPDTSKYTMLMGDSGNTGNTSTPVTLTFDQSAASFLPDVAGQAFVTGTYKPTNYVSGTPDTDLPSPAPAANPLPYAVNLNVFNGITPNGTWKLFVYDDGSGDGGSIAGGWSIDITTTGGGSHTITGLGLRVVNRLPAYPITSSGGAAGIKSLVKTSGAAANVNLTTLGDLDWWKYGVNASQYDTTAKIEILPRLIHGAFTIVPGFNAGGNAAHSFQWSDGTPIPAGSNNVVSLRCQSTVNSGWEFTVDAASTARKLTLFCTTFSCDSLLTVSISDGSSANVTDIISAPDNTAVTVKYEIEFAATTLPATLGINYKITAIPGATAPYLALSASALSLAGGDYTTITPSPIEIINRIGTGAIDQVLSLLIVNSISTGNVWVNSTILVNDLEIVNSISGGYVYQVQTLISADLEIKNRIPATYIPNSGAIVVECSMPYAEIISTALSYADSQDPEVIEKMPMFLKIVESRLNRIPAVQKQIGVYDIRYALGYQDYTLPGDFNSMSALLHVQNFRTFPAPIIYRYVPYKENIEGTFINSPEYEYSIMGRTLYINFKPDQNVVDNDIIQLKYYTRLRPLTSTNICNWVAANYPDTYVFGLLVEINSFKKDKVAAAMWNERFLEAVSGIESQDSEYRWNGPSLVMRTA